MKYSQNELEAHKSLVAKFGAWELTENEIKNIDLGCIATHGAFSVWKNGNRFEVIQTKGFTKTGERMTSPIIKWDTSCKGMLAYWRVCVKNINEAVK